MLQDKQDDAGVRQRTVEILEKIGGEHTLMALIETLADTTKTRHRFKKNERICDVAALVLARSGTPEALAAVAAWRTTQPAKMDNEEEP